MEGHSGEYLLDTEISMYVWGYLRLNMWLTGVSKAFVYQTLRIPGTCSDLIRKLFLIGGGTERRKKKGVSVDSLLPILR